MVEQMADVLETARAAKGLAGSRAADGGGRGADSIPGAFETGALWDCAAGPVAVRRKEFGHPSEEVFANLLDFYRIAWEYEPRSFPLQWDKDGKVLEAFTPDFYLPEFDLYVELTTMKQANVTRKNRKIRLLRAIYPHVNIQVFYQKDVQDLVIKYGLPERCRGRNERAGHRADSVHRRADRAANPGSGAPRFRANYAGREVKLIAVLKGSVFFLTALARELTVPVKVDFLAISSFANQRGAPGMVRIAKDLDDSIEGEDVILVEDIVDTGFTTRYLMQHLAGREPKSLAICTLLDRTARRIVQVPIDYRCFEIPDRFVVGFGLDYRQLYRGLKYIAVLDVEAPAPES